MTGTASKGARLWNGSSRVTGITSVAKPTGTRADIDITDLESTAVLKIPDIPDNGNVSFALNFDGTDAQHQALLALEASGASATWTVEFPETGVSTVTTFVFAGTVASLEASATARGKQEANLSLAVSGAVTVAHGATPLS